MCPSRVIVIIGEDYKLKETILRDYLTDKKYFIVLDDVCDDSEIWSDLVELLSDDQNDETKTNVMPLIVHFQINTYFK